jgi:hypothetical protein
MPHPYGRTVCTFWYPLEGIKKCQCWDSCPQKVTNDIPNASEISKLSDTVESGKKSFI